MLCLRFLPRLMSKQIRKLVITYFFSVPTAKVIIFIQKIDFGAILGKY